MSSTNTNMDVDIDNNGDNVNVAQHEQQEQIIKLHPLAIIGISDHHTRVSCGGSALPPSSPTIGILWGQKSAPRPTSGTHQHQTVSIIEAEEVESGNPNDSSTEKGSLTQEQMGHIQTKIELHQKVFPMHEVVGWYRVVVKPLEGKGGSDLGAGEEEQHAYALPTKQDLEIHNGWMGTFLDKPIFILMDATERKHHDSKGHIGGTGRGGAEGEGKDLKGKTDGEFAREKLDQDEELPLMMYENMGGEKGGSSAFINLEFELETFEPERIAVEQVFKTRPKVLRGAEKALGGKDTVASVSASKKQLDSKKKGQLQSQSKSQSQEEVQPTLTELHIQSVMTSVDAMNARVAILLDFLHKTRDGEIEPNHRLLREVMSLVKQLPLVMEKTPLDEGAASIASANAVDFSDHHGFGEEYEKQYGDMLVMSYLAALAKTTKAVVGYSEKIHVLEEHSTSGAGGFGRVEGRQQGRDLHFGIARF